MNREQLENMLVDYVYDELDEQTRVQFETAVLQWPDLAAEVDAHRQTRRMMRNVPELDPPATFTMDVVRAARLENAKPEKEGFWSRLTALMMQPSFAVATVFVAVASVGSFIATEVEDRGERLEVARTSTAADYSKSKPMDSAAEAEAKVSPSSIAKAPAVSQPDLAAPKESSPAVATATQKAPSAPRPAAQVRSKAPAVRGASSSSRYRKKAVRPRAKRVLDSKVTNWRFAATGAKNAKLANIDSSQVRLKGKKASLKGGPKMLGAPVVPQRLAGAPSTKRATPAPKALLQAYRAHLKAKRWRLAEKVLAQMNRVPELRSLVAKERKNLRKLAQTRQSTKPGLANSKKTKRTKRKASAPK